MEGCCCWVAVLEGPERRERMSCSRISASSAGVGRRVLLLSVLLGWYKRVEVRTLDRSISSSRWNRERVMMPSPDSRLAARWEERMRASCLLSASWGLRRRAR